MKSYLKRLGLWFLLLTVGILSFQNCSQSFQNIDPAGTQRGATLTVVTYPSVGSTPTPGPNPPVPTLTPTPSPTATPPTATPPTATPPTATPPTATPPTATPPTVPVLPVPVSNNGKCKNSILLAKDDGQCEPLGAVCVDSATVTCTPKATDCRFGNSHIRSGATVFGYQQATGICQSKAITCDNGTLKQVYGSPVGPQLLPIVGPVFSRCQITRKNPDDCFWKDGAAANGSTFVIGSLGLASAAYCANRKAYSSTNGVVHPVDFCSMTTADTDPFSLVLWRTAASCDGRHD